MLTYVWPGNIREMEFLVERAMILAQNGVLTIDVPAGAAPNPVGLGEWPAEEFAGGRAGPHHR